MKREEELQLEYEDILFKIMMDRVAQAEGAQMLEENQHLLEIPDAEVPQAIQQHAYKTIQTAFTKKKPQRRHTGTLRKGLRVAVVAVILLALLMGATFAAFPDVRAKFLNTILDIHDRYTNIFFTEKSSTSQVYIPTEMQFQINWIPEGFVIVDEVSSKEYMLRRYESNGKVISVCKSFPRSYSVDTEDAIITPMEMQGYEATLIEKNNEKHILWLNTDTSIVYYVYTDGLSLKILLEIAENLS